MKTQKAVNEIEDAIRKDTEYNGYSNFETWLMSLNLDNEQSLNEMVAEIRQELFKLQPQFKPKEPQKIQEDETDFFDRKSIKIRGFDVWGEGEEPRDPIQELETDYNETVAKGFRDAFCPLCHCERSVCKCHKEGY